MKKTTLSLSQLRTRPNRILVLGNHPQIIQSILDFDYLSHRQRSIFGIITGRRGTAKYFFGRREILLPTFPTLPARSSLSLPSSSSSPNLWFLNLLSARRALSSTLQLLSSGYSFAGGALFAENVPELHSLQLLSARNSSSLSRSPLILGPASVGLLVPGHLKLGAIGGITPAQISHSHLSQPGAIAVLSASGGMTNELINIAVGEGHHLSFALSFGGDRFPILSPRDAFLLAEQDSQTKAVLYYGELGGQDEYELVKLTKQTRFTKPVIAHIAGTVAALFPESPQFGHAKAKANRELESALAKRRALAAAGFQVSSSFSDFINRVHNLKL